MAVTITLRATKGSALTNTEVDANFTALKVGVDALQVYHVSGSGTPEGNVTAVVGVLYSRTDGGAGTTLYVKESGSGNTGWAAQ